MSANGDNLPEWAAGLAPEFGRGMRCAQCGYELGGLSIRGACPECGLPVRATLLAAVDPRASELAPLFAPRLTAVGVLVWAWGATVAALSVWVTRLGDVASRHFDIRFSSEGVLTAGLGALVLSGIGAMTMIRPHRGLGARQVRMAGLGVLLYLPLIALFWFMHMRFDPRGVMPYVGSLEPSSTRIALRLATTLLIAAGFALLWPNISALIARSFLMRTGRVDTQPVSVLFLTLATATAGDALDLTSRLASGLAADVLGVVKVVLIAVGSFLFTVALVGLSFDAWRLRRVLLEHPLGLADVLAERSSEGGDE